MATFIWHCAQGHVQEIEYVPGNYERIAAKRQRCRRGCDWPSCRARDLYCYLQEIGDISIERVALALFLSNREVIDFVTQVTETGEDWAEKVFALGEDGRHRDWRGDQVAARARRWEAFFIAWCRNEKDMTMKALARASAMVGVMAGRDVCWVWP